MEKERNLQSPADKFSKRNYRLQEDTLFERIRYHLLEGRKISEEETHILHRWEAAHCLLVSKNETDANVSKFLMKMYDISNFTAYKDIRNAKMLFGDVNKSSTEGLRYIVSQWCVEMYRMAYIAKDFDAMSNALGKLIKANNLDRQDPNLPDLTKIQPPVQVLSISLDFVNSPYFKMLAPKIQEEVIKLKTKIQAMLDRSQITDVMGMLMIEDTKYENVSDDTE